MARPHAARPASLRGTSPFVSPRTLPAGRGLAALPIADAHATARERCPHGDQSEGGERAEWLNPANQGASNDVIQPIRARLSGRH